MPNKLKFPYIPWAKAFKARVEKLYGPSPGTHQSGYKEVSKLLAVAYETVMNWTAGRHRPEEKYWKAIGVFMGWMKNATDHEGYKKTVNFFMGDACKSSPEEVSSWMMALKHRKRMAKRRRK